MLLVQLGINSTRDVWKFCQNWTSRRGESIWCFCSYFHLVLLLKQKLGFYSYFHLVPLAQFHFTFVFKIPFRHFVCFEKIVNCTAVQLMK
jgi:hypothetical protein